LCRLLRCGPAVPSAARSTTLRQSCPTVAGTTTTAAVATMTTTTTFVCTANAERPEQKMVEHDQHSTFSRNRLTESQLPQSPWFKCVLA
jgi:hypothetical protein